MTIYEKIREMVEQNKEDYISFLRDLVRADTTDYNEDNGQAILRRRLEQLPCEIDFFAPEPEKLLKKYEDFNEGHTYENRHNLVAVFKGEEDTPGLVLNGHMDTVFPNDPDAWLSDPFENEVRDGKLYGLGSCDMKSGLAGMTLALEILCKLGVKFRQDVILESVIDEEAGGGNGTLADIDRGYIAPAALVGEPTSLQPMCAHVGSVAFRVTFKGSAAHSNVNWEGVNAFEKAMPFIRGFYGMGERWQREMKHPLFHGPATSINIIRCGTGAVCVPDECVLEGNFTYLPGYCSAIEDFLAVLEEASQDEWLQKYPPKLEWLHHVKPYESNTDMPFLKSLLGTLKEQGSGIHAFQGFATGADARLLANVGGMATVILGPGNILNAHRANEYVILEEFLRAIELYADILVDYIGIEAGNN